MDFLSRCPCKSLLLFLILLAGVGGEAQAAAISWTGTTSTNWATGTNWSGLNTPPQSGDSLIFGTAAGGMLSNNLTTTSPVFNIAGFTFNTGAGAFVINAAGAGNGFVLTGDVLNNSSVLQTINNPFTLSGTRLFATSAGGGNLLLGGAIDGSGGFTAAGVGTVTLSGANSYSGGTNFIGGVLNVGSAGALGTTGTLSFGGGTLQYSAANQTDYSARFSAAALQTYRIDTNGQNVAFAAGLTSGGGTLDKLGAGTLTLNGSSSYGGGTTVSRGTLVLNNNTAAGGYNAGSITLGDGSTGNNNVELDFASGITGADLTLPGAGGVRRVNAITVANTGGSGTATLGFIGATSVIYTDVALSGPVVFTSNSSTRLQRSYMGRISGAGAGAGQNSVVFNLGAGNWLDLSPKLDGAGAGTANSFTGNLLVQSGNVEINGLTFNGNTAANENLTIPATASVTVNSGSILQFVWGSQTFDGLNGGGTLQRNAGDNQNTKTLTIGAGGGSGSFSGLITSAFNVIKTGAGTQILSGNNDYTGTTSILGGTLQLGNGAASGSFPIVNPITNNGMLAFNRSDDFTFGGSLTGSGGVTVNGNIVRFSAAQTYAGPTVANGTLVLPTLAMLSAATSALASSTVVTVGASGRFDFSNRAQTIAGLAGSGQIYSFGGSAGSLTVDVASGQTYTYSGVLGGSSSPAFSLTKSSPGTQVLSGVNLYTGGTTLSAGTLRAGVSSVTAGSGAAMAITSGPTGTSLLTVNGGTLDLSGFNLAVAGLAGSGGTVGSSSTSAPSSLTIVVSGSRSYAGTITDSVSGGNQPVSLTIAGSGTQTLAGANSYTGGTTLASGTLGLGSAGAVGTTGQLIFAGGALQYSASNTTDYSSRFSAAPGQAVNIDTNGQTVSLATGLTSNGGSLTKSGAGTLILPAANTYAGTTTINGGTLQLGNGGTTGTLAPAGVITANGTLAINRSNTVTQGVDFGPVIGSGGLSVLNGVTILTAANSYAGGTTVASGATLRLGADGNVGSIAGNVVNNGLFVFARADSYTYPGMMSGTGSVSLQGGGGQGDLHLTGANTYSGGTSVDASGKPIYFDSPSVTSGSGASLAIVSGPAGTGPLIINSGGKITVTDLGGAAVGPLSSANTNARIEGGGTLTIVTNGTSVYSGDIKDLNSSFPEDVFSLRIAGTGTQVLPTDQPFTGSVTVASGTLQLGVGGTKGSVLSNITNNGTVVFHRGGDYTYTKVISGTGGVVQKAGNVLRFSQRQTYTGPTQIEAGATLVLPLVSQGISASSVVTIATGGVLDLNNQTQVIGGLEGIGIVGSFGGSAGSLTVNVPPGPSHDFAGLLGVVNGNFAFLKTGSGTQIISSNANTYTGATTISGGTLQVGNGGTSGALPVGSAITNNATLAFNRSNTTTQGTDFAPAIAGTGQVIQQGSGTLVLSGANTYTGATLVNAGTLKLTGSLGNTAVTVGSASILDGEGTIGATGSLTLGNGSTLIVDPTTAGALSVGGNLTLSGTVGLALNPLPASIGPGQTIRLLNYSGTLTGSAANIPTTGFRNGVVSTVTGTPNQVNLSFDSKALTWFGSTAAWDVNTTANWNAGADKFFRYDALTFDDSGGIKAVTLNTAAIPASVTFANTAGNNYSISGTGSIQGPVTQTGTGGVTINVPITGFGGLVKSGPANMTLTAANSYTGATTINGGTLQLGNGGTTGSISPSLTITNSSALAFNRSNSVTQGMDFGLVSGIGSLVQQGSGTVILTAANNYGGGTVILDGAVQIGAGGTTGSIAGDVTNNATLIFNRSDDFTYVGTIGGTGGLVQAGNIVRFTAAHTYTGPTLVNAGTLILPPGLNFGLSNSTIATVAAGAKLDLSGRNQQITGLAGGGAVVSTAGTLTLTPALGQTYTFAGNFGAAGASSFSVAKAGAGTQVFSGASVHTGGTTVTGGLLQVGGVSVTSSSGPTMTIVSSPTGTGVVTVSGATLDLAGFDLAVGGLSGSGGTIGSSSTAAPASLTIAGSATADYAGVIADSVAGGTRALSVMKAGSGTQRLSGTNTYTGSTTVDGGTLYSTALGALSSTSAITVNNPGATLAVNYGGPADYTEPQVVGLLAKTTFGPGSAFALDTGNAAGPVTYGPALNVPTGFTKLGSGTLVLAGANTYLGATLISAGTLQLGTGGVGGSLSPASVIINNATLAINRSTTLQGVDLGPIIGTGNVSLPGGTTIMTASNTYAGGTSIASGATLQLGNSLGTGFITGAVSNGGTLAFKRSDDATFNVVIAGSGTVRNDGSVVRLTNAQSYTGPTLLNSGFLVLPTNTDNGLSHDLFLSPTPVTFSGGASLDMSGRSQRLAGIDGLGTLLSFNSSGSTLTLDVAFGETHTFSGNVGGSSPNFGLLKTGLGAQTLTAANSYTGATNIFAGTLKLGGANATSAVSVASGAVLEGEGSITTGSLTLSGGSSLSFDGSTTAALTVGGNVTLNGTVTLGNTGGVSAIGPGPAIRILNYSGTLGGPGTFVTSAPGFRNPAISTATAGQVNLTFDSKALTWTGSTAAWDVNTTANWNGGTDKFFHGDAVTFDDTGTIKAIVVNPGPGNIVPASSSITFANSTGNNYTISGAGSISGALVHSGAGAVLIDVPITAGSITKSSAGTLTLARANSYTGTTLINAGTLQLGNGGATGSLSPGSAITNNGTLVFNRSGTLTQGTDFAAVSGSGSVVQQGSGTVVFNAANTYSGGTTIASGATLQLGTGGASGSLSGDVTDQGAFVFKRNDDFTFSGIITGTGMLIHSGFVLRFANAQYYTGATYINSGTLVLSTGFDNGLSHDLLSPASPVTVAAGATLDMATRNQRLGGLDGDGTVLSFLGGGGTLTLETAAGETHTFTGNIGSTSAIFGLTKSGLGTQVLTGTSTYQLPTTVSAGTLVVNGSLTISPEVSVSAGGTLSGSGSVKQLSGAGQVAPGGGKILTATDLDASGGLDFTFKLTLAGAPVYANAAASGNDLLHLTGTTPFTVSSGNIVTVDFSGATLAEGQVYQGGFFLSPGAPDPFLGYAFTYTGVPNGLSAQYRLATVASAGFATGTVVNGEVLEFTIVPEPGSASLLVFSGLVLSFRRWKKASGLRR